MKLEGSVDKMALVIHLAKYYARYRKNERKYQEANPILAMGYRMDAITYRSLIEDVKHDAI